MVGVAVGVFVVSGFFVVSFGVGVTFSIEELLVVVLSNDNMVFLERLRSVEDIYDVTLVQFDGEYHG